MSITLAEIIADDAIASRNLLDFGHPQCQKYPRPENGKRENQSKWQDDSSA
jgi:hypothetical protein